MFSDFLMMSRESLLQGISICESFNTCDTKSKVVVSHHWIDYFLQIHRFLFKVVYTFDLQIIVDFVCMPFWKEEEKKKTYTGESRFQKIMYKYARFHGNMIIVPRLSLLLLLVCSYGSYEGFSVLAVECTGENMYYVQAIDVQKPSCQVPNPPPRTSPPVDGCECEEPFIMEEDLHQCVLPEECGCFTDDEPPLYYPVSFHNTV